MTPPLEARFAVTDLIDFATGVLAAAGLEARHATTTAAALVEADLLGFSTHGVDLLPDYVGLLATRRMAASGQPSMTADGGASFVADAGLLPGPSVLRWCVDEVVERSRRHGVVTGLVCRSQHTGCHAAHLLRATDRGLLVTIAATHEAGGAIAPFGGTSGVFAPPPFAVGIPTEGDPILIDMTMATTAMRSVRHHRRRGQRLPHPWLLTAGGTPTDDPSVLFDAPQGTILPLGGLDHGHKGFALLLYLEALTSALAGPPGRDDAAPPTATVVVQVFDPDAFGGSDAFRARMSAWVAACRASAPRAGTAGVRIPGARALASRRDRLERGIPLEPTVLARLREAGAAAGLSVPRALE